MSRELSNQLKAQMFRQESDDPFLILVTLAHPSFTQTIYLVNNMTNVVSRGKEYIAFPFKFVLPNDDGETERQVTMEFDNTSTELVAEIRKVTEFINVTISMVLASNPDRVEIELGELRIRNIMYNKSSIQAHLFMDDFLNTDMTSERYTPTNFPGVFQ